MIDFKAILDAIVQYGTPLVVVVLLIIYIRDRAKTRNKITDKREEEDAEQGSQWAELAYDTVRTALKDNKVEASLQQEGQEKVTARFDMAKHTLMRTALKNSGGAKRILYFAYHNGGDDYERNPFKRMSCETEVVGPDVPPIQNKYNNLFRTFLYPVYTQFNAGKSVAITNMELYKESDPGFYTTMTQDGIGAFYAEPIKNERGNTFAFIAYCYSDPQTNAAIPEMVDNTAHRLEGLYMTKIKGGTP
jgi:hypothetical protein